MRTMKTPISKAIYNKLKKLKYTDLFGEVEKILPPQYTHGYGIYDVKLKNSEDTYYIEYQLGDTCD